MKIVLLCADRDNHRALANKIAAQFGITAIVIEQRLSKKKRTFSKIIEAIADRSLFRSITNAWSGMQAYYRRLYPAYPAGAEILKVSSVNNKETISFIRSMQPDLLVVSGTGMVKQDVLSIPVKYGIVNLHTGLSPYVKGAPNCTNWCIAKDTLQLIGNTVMWINAGIDSGDIISTERTLFNGSESLADVHIKVMEHAHDLYCRAIGKIESDFANCNRVKQDSIAGGITFYAKQWDWKNKWKLLRNFKNWPRNISEAGHKESLPLTVSLTTPNTKQTSNNN